MAVWEIARKNPTISLNQEILKFLVNFTENTKINEDTIKLLVCHWNESTGNTLVKDCCQFKEYLRVVTVEENLECP